MPNVRRSKVVKGYAIPRAQADIKVDSAVKGVLVVLTEVITTRHESVWMARGHIRIERWWSGIVKQTNARVPGPGYPGPEVGRFEVRKLQERVIFPHPDYLYTHEECQVYNVSLDTRD
ncbi:hypothetical protein K435DRAFT_802553 [Dendrothele bispora CBS 962.96]|uniref:Uncharacterized protein n=1 Tax=Dendrothele bispora (strain CBS 962.96) TaxID=1314807 RepID=A0A4S8LL52_DENBC|nr:hypothetical protein K435DRAFT_802553 [Dendrothele bispora CBS 962.96]